MSSINRSVTIIVLSVVGECEEDSAWNEVQIPMGRLFNEFVPFPSTAVCVITNTIAAITHVLKSWTEIESLRENAVDRVSVCEIVCELVYELVCMS